ncbi:MAG: GntR family transcriptional regulator [Gammaproteobacteria bacterium]|nr:GntR family transcriptional regulator [Gammaproteobacteria bacterium]
MESLKSSEFREGMPLYLQIRDVIASELAGGAWKPVDQLPTEPELSARFKVS